MIMKFTKFYKNALQMLPYQKSKVVNLNLNLLNLYED